MCVCVCCLGIVTMASLWKFCCLLSLLLRLQSSTCLDQEPADSVAVSPVHGEGTGRADGRTRSEDGFLPADAPLTRLLQYDWPSLHSDRSRRKLLQAAGAAVPFPPLKVLSNGKPCILFRARKLSIGYQNQKQLDLTNQAFSPHQPVDTSSSVCNKDKATLVMRFGDVADLRGLSIRLQLSSTLYESSGQRWFSLDGVSLLYNSSEEAAFNASEVFAPTASSYHCLHVSSLQRHSGLLQPHNEHAQRWSLTFTDFQIQAFDITSGKFSPASDCATFLTPAILMGLVTSLILLLVLAYGLHMLIHLKHIEHYDERKAAVYFPRGPELPEHCSVSTAAQRNSL